MAMKADEYLKSAEAAGAQLSGFTPGNDVAEANQTLADVSAGRPTNYTSADADRLGGLYESIMNRGMFEYDPNKDGVYQQAKQNYQQMGMKAAQDTAGQMGAMNGGYGSTWAQTAGAQQYGEYLKGINDILPQLQQNAEQAYNSETDRLANLYNTAQQRDDIAYGRSRDELADWQNERAYAQQQADQAYSRDYQQYSDRMNMANTAAGWAMEDSMQEKSDNYSWAVTLIKNGILPTEEVLTTAGISMDDAIALAKKYGYGKGHGHGGGSGWSAGTGAAAAGTPAALSGTGTKISNI